MESLRSEKTCKIIISNPNPSPLCPLTVSLSATSPCFLNTSRNGNSHHFHGQPVSTLHPSFWEEIFSEVYRSLLILLTSDLCCSPSWSLKFSFPRLLARMAVHCEAVQSCVPAGGVGILPAALLPLGCQSLGLLWEEACAAPEGKRRVSTLYHLTGRPLLDKRVLLTGSKKQPCACVSWVSMTSQARAWGWKRWKLQAGSSGVRRLWRVDNSQRMDFSTCPFQTLVPVHQLEHQWC